jgi:hypothetical protein
MPWKSRLYNRKLGTMRMVFHPLSRRVYDNGPIHGCFCSTFMYDYRLVPGCCSTPCRESVLRVARGLSLSQHMHTRGGFCATRVMHSKEATDRSFAAPVFQRQ